MMVKLARLSIFEWLVVAVLAFGLLFAFLFLTRKEKWVVVEVKIAPEQWWWEAGAPPYWLVDTIKKGDEQYDSLGRKIAEVVDVKNYQWLDRKKLVYLTLNLKAGYNRRTKKFTFNHRPLEIGKPIELEIGNVGVKGLVTDVDKEKDRWQWQEQTVEVRVTHWNDVFPETLGLLPWRAQAIKVGDKMEDSQGRVVAEVLEKYVRPAEKIITTADGRVLLREDPLKKDVTLMVKLKTVNRAEVTYFLDDLKIKVGSTILLALPQIDIWPEITRIVE